MIPLKDAELAAQTEQGQRDAAEKNLAWLQSQAQWMDETIIEIIISEAQNEVADFKKWGFDIIPHRARDEAGLRDGGRQARGCRDGFKNPEHPFRVAIVCAMWLTGFDVECLRRSTSTSR